jgi:hypothetical protein
MVACDPQIVELDPLWPQSSKADSGTSEHGRDGDPEISDQYPAFPHNCLSASSDELLLRVNLSEKGAGMLIGNMGSAMSKAEVLIDIPEGWSVLPNSVFADEQGRFAFLLDRQAQTWRAEQKIQAHATERWCRFIMAEKPTNNRLPRRITAPPHQTCNAGETLSLSLQSVGKLMQPVDAYSSHPQIASIADITTTERPGIPTISLSISCKHIGSAQILLGNAETEPISFPISVK